MSKTAAFITVLLRFYQDHQKWKSTPIMAAEKRLIVVPLLNKMASDTMKRDKVVHCMTSLLSFWQKNSLKLNNG